MRRIDPGGAAVLSGRCYLLGLRDQSVCVFASREHDHEAVLDFTNLDQIDSFCLRVIFLLQGESSVYSS